MIMKILDWFDKNEIQFMVIKRLFRKPETIFRIEKEDINNGCTRISEWKEAWKWRKMSGEPLSFSRSYAIDSCIRKENNRLKKEQQEQQKREDIKRAADLVRQASRPDKFPYR